MVSLSPEELGRMHAERRDDGQARTTFLSWQDRLPEDQWQAALAAYEQRSQELQDEAQEVEEAEAALLSRTMVARTSEAPPEWVKDTS